MCILWDQPETFWNWLITLVNGYNVQRWIHDLSLRPRLHQKIRGRDSRLEIRDWLLKIQKKILSQHGSQNFSNFRNFSYPLWLFLTCRNSRQKPRWITEVSLAILLLRSKSQSNRLVTETCSLWDRAATWKLRDRDSQIWVSRPRPSFETPSLII